MAAVANNKWGMTGIDALTPREALGVAAALFATSVLALVVLGRAHVTVRYGTLSVRNPLRKYELALAAVRSLERGFLGFPSLQVRNGRAIRVMGLGESTKDAMEGGAEHVLILRAVICESHDDSRTDCDPQVRKTWAVMDGSLALLLMGWLAYALPTFFFS